MGEERRFRMRAAAERRIPLDGAPARRLPEWGGSAACDGVRFILHPPIDFEISYQVSQYVLFLPFAAAVADVALGEESLRRRTLPAGSGMFAPPQTLVRARVLEPVEFLVVAAEPSRIEPVITRAAGGKPWSPEPIARFVDQGVAALAREARRALLSDPLLEPAYLEALSDALFARFACKMLGSALGPTPREALAPALLRRIIRTIEDRLAQGVSLQELAAEANLSRWHFARAFQASTGLPPREFLISRRIARARELLASTEDGIADIAARLGFASHGHLTAAFKKRVGVTPAAYRRAYRGASASDDDTL